MYGSLTQNSPQEFLTIQYSVPSSATPQPATDTMWFMSEMTWNSANTPPSYASRPLVAMIPQLPCREDGGEGTGSHSPDYTKALKRVLTDTVYEVGNLPYWAIFVDLSFQLVSSWNLTVVSYFPQSVVLHNRTGPKEWAGATLVKQITLYRHRN